MERRLGTNSPETARIRLTQGEMEFLDLLAVYMGERLGRDLSRSDVMRGGLTMLGTFVSEGGWRPRTFPWPDNL